MNDLISPLAVIYKNVRLGLECQIEPFVIIGVPPRGRGDGELETVIGDHAVIRSHTVIYAGNNIGSHFQTGNKVNIREENAIGDHVSIGTLSVVEHHVTIAARVRIHTQAFVPEYTTLEDGCWIGPNVVITNAKYPRSPNVKQELKGAHVKAGAIVGANSTLMPGITLGVRCLVGAGSVVTRDVEDYAVVVGNPARKIKTIRDLPY